MSSHKNLNSLPPQSLDFNHSDEYDAVPTYELILMSDQNCETTTDNLPHASQFSSLCQYEENWNELFNKQEIDLEILKQLSIEGKLRSSHFRSVCWRTSLGILHKQPAQWNCQLQTYRNHYNELCAELEHYPWNVNKDINLDNPLSQESESVWQKYFSDEELKSVILQDVKRTFPDIDYFRKEDVQKIMVRILFCYARQNSGLCYRQGMHEILAPIILVLQLDHLAFDHARKQNYKIDKNLSNILCSDFLEHDAYSIFKNVMSHIQCTYRISSTKEEEKTDQNEILTRLDYIKKNIFQEKDPQLSEHLEKLDIPMHLFGIRWLRLLFGREFLLQDLLVLWDCLFANNFEIVNHIVVAMLVAIRHILLEGDYNACLSTLMNYPNNVNMAWIVAYSLHLRQPTKYPVPDAAPLKTYTQHFENQQILPLQRRRLKKNSSNPSKWFSTKQNLRLEDSGNSDGFIIHGFVVNDSNLPEVELEQIKMVLSVVHHKLLQFHSLLKAKFQGNINSDIELVTDGLYELACLLKNYGSCEVETACEAAESKERDLNSSPPNKNLMAKANPSPPLIGAEKKSHTLPKVKKGLRSGELKVFKHKIGGCISGAPMTDPLYLIKSLDALPSEK